MDDPHGDRRGMIRALLLAASLLAPCLAVPPARAQEARQAVSGPAGLVPDAHKLPGDGADDGPSIQRAIDLACSGVSRRIDLLGRHYSVQTPISMPCQISVSGQGWQEQPVGNQPGSAMTGTWLDFTAGAFGPQGTASPFTITGNAAAGSIVERIGVTQPVTMPAEGATSWSPPSTPFVIAVENTNGGVELRDIMCRGVDKCISAHVAGRTSFRNIRGQAWRVLIKSDKIFDVQRLDEVHFWPFYTVDVRVLAFQQANAVAVLSERNDTPLYGRIFVFGANAGVAFGNSAAEGPDRPGGTTTGAAIDSLSCDFVRHCFLGTAEAHGVQVQIGQLRTYGQAMGADDRVAARAGMLPGSDAIDILGRNGTVQVGNLENFGTDDTTIRLSNADPSNVQIGSAYVIGTRLSANATFATMTGGPHQVMVAMPPMFTPDMPPGWSFANRGGTGSLYWPRPAKQN